MGYGLIDAYAAVLMAQTMGTNGKISGNNTICNTANYSAPTGGTSYNWTITQGANLVSLTGNGTANITLTALPNASGQITLSLNMGNNCGSVTATKTIWVGVPQFNIFTFGNDFLIEACIASTDCLTPAIQSSVINASFSGMSASEINTDANWEWVRENNLIMLNSLENRTQVCPLAIGSSSFKVRAKNACGWSEWIDYPSFEIIECPNNFRVSSNVYIIYPNPSKEIVNIELRDSKIQPEKGAKISGTLFDLMGQTKSKVQITDNKANFSVQGLYKGVYVLKIYINDQVETHQIIVE
jgi:hypothetical protein